MARGDIRQKISLDGAEEVRRQLALIGSAGEKALRDLNAATVASSASLGRFTQLSASLSTAFAATGQALAPVRAAFSDLGTRVAVFGNAVRGAAGPILPFNANMLAMAAAVTAAVAPLALFAQAKKAALATDDLVDTAENLNVTTEELIAFRQISEASGASFDTLEKALQKGSRTLGEAAAATKDHRVAVEGQVSVLRGSTPAFTQAAKGIEIFRGSQEALTEVMQGTVRVLRGSGSLADVTKEYEVIARLAGTTVQKLTQMGQTDRFLAETKALSSVKDETERARLANAAFGKSYADMLPIMRLAETTLKPTIARVKELGQGVSETEKAMSERFLQGLARMNTAFGRMSTFLGGALGTAMLPIFEELERVVVANRVAIEEFSTTISRQVNPVVTDLVTIIGNLGRTMEEQQPLHTDFGKGLVSTLGTLKEAALGLAAAFKTLSDAVDVVLIPINKTFGTALTGGVVLATALVLKFVGAFALLGGIVGLVKSLGVAMVAIGTAVGWPVVFLAGLVGIGAAMLKYGSAWSNFTGTVSAFNDMMRAAGEAIARADFAGLKRGLDELDRITFDAIRSSLGGLPSLAKQAVDGIEAAFSEAWADTTRLIDFSGLRTSLADLPGLAKQAVDGTRAAFSEAWTATAMLIGLDGIRSSLGALPGLAQTAWTAVSNAAIAGLTIVKAGWTEFTIWLTSQNQTFWASVTEAATAVDQNIRKTFGELAGWVSTTLGGALAGIWDAFSAAAEAAFSKVGGLLKRLVDSVQAAAAAVSRAFSSSPPPAALAPRPPQTGLVDPGDFGGGADEAGKAVAAVTVLRGAVGKTQSAVTVLKGAVVDATDAFGNQVTAMRSAVKPVLDTSDAFKSLGVNLSSFPDIAGNTAKLNEFSLGLGAVTTATDLARTKAQAFGTTWREEVASILALAPQLEAAMKAVVGSSASTATAPMPSPGDDGVGVGGGGPLTGLVDALQKTLDMLGAVRAGIAQVPAGMQQAAEAIRAAFQQTLDAIRAGFSALPAEVQQTLDTIKEAFSELPEVMAGVWDSFSKAAADAFTGVDGLLDRLVSRISSIGSAIGGLLGGGGSGGGGGGGGLARGGLIRGPGTGTSDSILARVSNREFVEQAAAVDYYGAGLFDLLNRMAIPRDQLRAALAGMRGFSLGGLVDSARGAAPGLQMPRFSLGGLVEALNRLQMPKFGLGGLVDSFGGLMEGLSRPLVPRQRYATGGLVAAPAGGGRGTPVHFHFPGGESFGPMITDERIAEGLGRLARRGKLLSAGRRPGHAGS